MADKREIFKNKEEINGLMGKKRHIWHNSQLPAFLLAIAIIILSLFSGIFSGAGILIFASIAASAVILVHKRKHHLTTMGTITMSYFIAGILSIALVNAIRTGRGTLEAQVFAVLFIIGGVLYWLNLFHLPAIMFAMAYTVYVGWVEEYIFMLLLAIWLFIIIRFLIYVYHDHFSVRDFIFEFIKEEKKLIRKEEKKLKKI